MFRMTQIHIVVILTDLANCNFPSELIRNPVFPPLEKGFEFLEDERLGFDVARVLQLCSIWRQWMLVEPDRPSRTRAIKEEKTRLLVGIGGEDSFRKAHNRMQVEVSQEFFLDSHINPAISEEEADTRSKAKRAAEAALQSAQASVEVAKLNLEYTHITAPISGRISRKLITEGNLVNASQGQSTLLTTIVSLDPIYCYFDADERSILIDPQISAIGSRRPTREHSRWASGI